MKALCAGSFDPVTVGHYDFISRAAAMFDGVVVAVTNNTEKRYMFTHQQRIAFVKQAFAAFDNVTVVSSDGWTADLVKENGADVIVKGIRGSGDLEYERLIATVNREITGVETLFLPCNPQFVDISSTAVREMIKYGKDFGRFLPKGVEIDKRED